MTGIERLRDIVDDGPYSGGMIHISVQKLREICEQIEREVGDISGYESDVLAFVEEKGGLDALKKRLMPEGMEWPTVDGKPVDFVTGYEPSLGVLEAVSIYSNGACEVMGHDGIIKDATEIHIAAPKVLDADGVEIRVGDTVYLLPGEWCDVFPCLGYHGGEELEVFLLHADHVVGGIGCRDTRRPKGTCYPRPSQLTHRAPVIAADGEPLREGEHVYHVETGAELVVKSLPKPGEYQAVVVFALPTSHASHLTSFDPNLLTHERHDSWERLEEDARGISHDVSWNLGNWSPSDFKEADDNVLARIESLVRRAKALAGVSE